MALHTGSRVLSVVIPTYNDSHCLELTLRSLTQQTLSSELFEVVVVRDGPARTQDSVEDFAKQLSLQVHTLPERRGRSAARNAGLALVQGHTVVFLDSDCYAHPDLLARHHAFHAGVRYDAPHDTSHGGLPEARDDTSPHADHDAQPVGRVLLGQRYEIDLPQLSLLIRDEPIPPAMLAGPECRDLKFLGVEDAAIEQCLQTPWLFAHTNNASMPADTLAAVGGFNEEFGTRWGWEDVELFYRIYQHLGGTAASFVYDPQAVCYHLPQYRNVMLDYADWFINEPLVRRLHPHLDWEFHGLRMAASVSAKVRYYRDLIDYCRHTDACRLAPAWDRLRSCLAELGPARTLLIGTGIEELANHRASMTFDYASPVSDRNFHLIGTSIPAPDGAFDVVINVDFWRLLQWGDLCDFLREATRVAPLVALVRTASARLPYPSVVTDDELGYLCRCLGHSFDVAVDDDPDATAVLMVRPRSLA